jgi:propane monooxygenase reductase subunit
MGEKHTVRFEPVGIEIDVDEDETVLNAAFRQGIMLPHGCKEGQCTSCKSFMLEGDDIDLDKYSTFALPEFEQEEGFTLLCRTHPYEDLTIELMNYDPDMIRSEIPIQDVSATVETIEELTHDLRRLVVRITEPEDVLFLPGQYMDIAVPGTGQHRSFSMANTSARESKQLEFVIKIYPDGLFSQFLETGLQIGDEVSLTGPYGMFTLRENRDSDLVFIGGGAGMAPILSVLRSMAERGIDRSAIYYYGARRASDLCYTDEMAELADRLPDFRFVPVLSDEDWDGETGMVTDVVAAREAGRLAECDAYMCGPPPMVEAGQEMLEREGVGPDCIFFDKFTTTGSSED